MMMKGPDPVTLSGPVKGYWKARVSIVSWWPDGPILESWNDTSHLRGADLEAVPDTGLVRPA